MSLGLNWINPEDYSFNCLLLMERFQLQMMFGRDDAAWKRNMGIALNANPAVMWYVKNRCPERAVIIDRLAADAPCATDSNEIRKAEVYLIADMEDWVIYTTPEAMAKGCDFIRGWDKVRLFNLADFDGKVVLDVGAGSGRLTFAAAEKAAWVYASEPVETLREFMRDKIKSEGISNVRVLDGLVTELPFPDDTFDIVMSGHVVGDAYDEEIAELTRVCKSGGWLLDCPGDSEEAYESAEFEALISRGWEEIHYVGSFGKDVFCYRKQVVK